MYEEETSSIDDLNFLRANGDSCLLKSGDDCLSVKGRLRGALNFWNDIHAPQFILDVIESGYNLPLLQIPSPFVARNNSSALDECIYARCVGIMCRNGGYVMRTAFRRVYHAYCLGCL